jgi:hypothetical protein
MGYERPPRSAGSGPTAGIRVAGRHAHCPMNHVDTFTARYLVTWNETDPAGPHGDR